MEEFYDTHFPDDIPDEWAKSEQLISHGDGLLGPTDVPNIWKYSRSYMNKKSRLSWGVMRDILSLLEPYKSVKMNDNCLTDTINEHYSALKTQLELGEEGLKKLRPVRKILRVS
jgi:hypothetical protein